MSRLSPKYNFRNLVRESALVHPKIHVWARKQMRGVRESHHGWEHAREVSSLARSLASRDGVMSRDAYPLMSIVAILHDFADGKIDLTGDYQRKLDHALAGMVSHQLHSFVAMAVQRVSMSYEQKYGSDFTTVLTPAGALVRDYVSDADKLLSLGARGHVRIVQYNESKILSRVYNDPGHVDVSPRKNLYRDHTLAAALLTSVSDVMNGRMRVVPNYIRTHAAKVRVGSLYSELFKAHETWKAQFSDKF